MKINKLFLLVLISIVIYSCSASDNDSANSKDEELPPLEVDFSDPESVVQVIFEAAATERFEVLWGLCDPEALNDMDTERICMCGGENADPELIESFKEYFSKGKVIKVLIKGDYAEVDFKFGPDGTMEETMGLVKRDGKWYLTGF